MFATTLKSLWGHKLRFVLTMVAIIIGVGFMAGTLIFTDTVGKTFDDLFSETTRGTDAVIRSTNMVESQAPGQEQRALVEESLLGPIRATSGVAAAEPQIYGVALVVGRDGKVVKNGQAPALGFNWSETPKLNVYTIDAGQAPRGDQLMVDKATADKGGLGVGDKVKVITQQGPQELTLTGIAKLGDADGALGATTAMFDTPTAQRLLGKPGLVNSIAVVAAEGTSQQGVVDNLRPVLPSGTEAITGEAYTREQQDALRKSLSFFNYFLLAFAFIALFVGCFYIYNTFSIIVTQRSKEMALLRAVGATRGQVLRSVMLEAVVIGAVASGLGLVFGIFMSGALRELLHAGGLAIPAKGTVLLPVSMLTAFGVGIMITAASAFFPAWRASKVAPIAALRDVSVDTSSTSTRRIVLGGLVLALGLYNLVSGLFLGASNAIIHVAAGAALTFVAVAVLGPIIARPLAGVLGWPAKALRGVTGGLARQNAMRNPKRTSSTAAALMIGVGLVSCVTILASSLKASLNNTFDKSFRSDLIVDSGDFTGQTGLSPDLARRLGELDELSVVSPIRVGGVQVGESPKFVLGVDPATVAQVADLEVVQGSLSDLDAGNVAVYEQTAADTGVKVGDTLRMRFPLTGDEPVKVAAIYKRQDIGGEYTLGLVGWDARFPETFDFQIYTKVAPEVSIADAQRAVEGVTSSYANATVLDMAALKKKQLEPFDAMLGMIYGMLFLAIIIALLGIVTTLGLSIHERTRELGLLRAVGMSRSQMRSTVRWESVIISMFGTMLGIVVGVFFGWAIVAALRQQGVEVLVVPIDQLVVVTGIAGVFGVVAAIWPARRAARLDVLAALSAE